MTSRRRSCSPKIIQLAAMALAPCWLACPQAGDTPDGGATAEQDAGAGTTPALIDCGPVIERAWETVTLPRIGGFKPRADVAVGRDGRLRVAYNTARSDDGFGAYGVVVAEEQADGAYESLVVQEPIYVDTEPPRVIDNEYPTLVVDEAGTSHVFFNHYVQESEQIDVFVASGDAENGFSAPTNLTRSADVDELGVSVAQGSDGAVHAVFLRRKPRPEEPSRYFYSVGYLRFANGEPSPVEVVAETARIFEGHPEQAVAVGADGAVHALFRVPASAAADGQLVYRRRKPGTAASSSTWGETLAVSDASTSASSGAIAVDGSGTVHFTYALGLASQTMHYRWLDEDGLHEPVPLSAASTDQGSVLGMSAAADGTVHVVYRRNYGVQADVLYRRGKDGVFDDELRLTNSPNRDEQLAAIDVTACGEAAVVHPDNFENLPLGEVHVSRLR